jgi:hypothetical protein
MIEGLYGGNCMSKTTLYERVTSLKRGRTRGAALVGEYKIWSAEVREQIDPNFRDNRTVSERTKQYCHLC